MKELFSILRSNIRRSGSEANRWFRAGKAAWLWLALFIAALLVFYALPGELPSRVLWAGTFFELLGIGAVVLGIDRARRAFGKPSVLQGMWIWIKDVRFIFFRRQIISASVGIAAGSGMAASVGVVVSRAPQTIEQRIALLEKRTTELQTKIGEVDHKVDTQRRDLQAALEEEAAARKAADQGVSKMLEEGVIGDNDLELAGVFYLCFGVILANLSTYVAGGLQWLGLS